MTWSLRTWLLVLVIQLLPGCQGKRPTGEAVTGERAFPATFMRGMTFAHEGYRGHNGYGGDLVGPSLDSLKRLNVNAIAIIPYTFMRDMQPIDTLPIPEHYGSENDSAVLVSIRQAQAR
ncbi:MAG: hypothetical protein WA952_14770, partial [Lewinella sp.]